ncbi:cytochrome P450 [Allokutzneria albata]|uniref:Cytochrome P450 n=1 Tax=Allokutzneria albata TaxID=211114 RepID=A0A1H0CQR4_ALLAB|nr:cytochrome P450 [Allokutzneria albata]SDN60101.1 Cytochrome P450 [Allokutzneria albata]
MTSWRLPLTDPGAHAPGQLAAFYDRLHASGLGTFRDAGSRLFPVWRYEFVENILKGADPAVTNANTLDPLTPMGRFAANPGTWSSLVHLVGVPKATANSNGAQHEEVRRAVFAPPGGLSLSPATNEESFGELIRRRVAAVADDVERSSAGGEVVDFAAVFARPLSAGIISEIVGFAASDEGQVRTWSDGQTSLLGRVLDRPGQVVGVRGLSDLSRACRRLVAERVRTPADDMASHLLRQGLPDKRAAAVLMNIMAAGYSTTYGTLLNAMRHLLSEEGQENWDALSDKAIVPALTTELMRIETGLIGWKRKAKNAVRLGESEIPAGGQILVMLGAANRDPEHFHEPHRVRLDRAERKEPKALTFGAGPHLCIGREVSRLEIGEALSVLRERFPRMRLALSGAEADYDPDYLFRTPVALPVRL